MTYQDGQIGDHVTFIRPNVTIGAMQHGQIIQMDGTSFIVEVIQEKYFSPGGGGNLWLSVPRTICKLDPQYCHK